MINSHYPARDRQSHTVKEVYTGVHFDQFLGCESTGVTTGRRVKKTPHPIHFVYRSILILIHSMQAYLPSARSEGNIVYNLADEPAEQAVIDCI